MKPNLDPAQQQTHKLMQEQSSKSTALNSSRTIRLHGTPPGVNRDMRGSDCALREHPSDVLATAQLHDGESDCLRAQPRLGH